MHEGRISDRKMGRTGLFSQFFPFFIEFFEFCFVCCFFFCQFLAFNRIRIDFFLHHQFIDFAITCFQNTDTFFCFLQVVLPFTETCLFFSLVWIRKPAPVCLRKQLWKQPGSEDLFSPDNNHSCRYNLQRYCRSVPEYGWQSG